jgi:GST-like protein
VPFAIKRFVDESERLLRVLDTQLASARFLCGEQLTIADIACCPYARSHSWAELDVSSMPHLRRWLAELDARESFQIGLTVPSENRDIFGLGERDAIGNAPQGQEVKP